MTVNEWYEFWMTNYICVGVLVEQVVETLAIAEITMSMAEKYMALSAIGSALNTYLIVAKEEES